ncbi:MAG TPA: hypothetical protein PKY12_00860 [Catalimonadaceae bacterium]|nr:hypothetical protein [Catalimonadaceae bacterium]
MMQADTILTGTMILGLLAMVLFFIKNDEFLGLIVYFFYTSGLNRYNMVISGRDRWVAVAYSKNIFSLNNELGLQALNYFFIGTMAFSVSYFVLSMFRKPPPRFKDSNLALSKFLAKYQTYIVLLFIAVGTVSFYARLAFFGSYIQGGGGIAFGGSYYIMIGFGLGGVITLMFLVFNNYNNTTQILTKLLYGVLIAFAGSLTYSTSGRFQFLSWSITIGIMYVGDRNPFYKLRIYIIGGLIVSLAFGLAGVQRRTDTSRMGFFQKLSLAWDRNQSTEDMTMLDGFMMVLQVYPQHLNYHFGTEHLEVLYRPIPRAWWPGKPLGGYANKLGLNDNMGGGSVGISQSIYGSFYGEGGVAGIYILSAIYALILNYIMVSSVRYSTSVRHMIKGLTFASAVPLLRGGDLPGIYAFIGMTFWPVWLFIYQYNKFLRVYNIETYLANLWQQRAIKEQKDKVIEVE